MEPDIKFATATDGVSIAWTSIGSGSTLIHLPGVPFSNIEGVNLYRKIDARGRAEATAWAIRNGVA